jgi:peptidoglycan hydrolase-like protein with peptidoglycan-binding domain
MKTTKKALVISLLIVGITGQVFASWWNPFTWSWFKKERVVAPQVEQVLPPVDEQNTNNETVSVSKEQTEIVAAQPKKQETPPSTGFKGFVLNTFYTEKCPFITYSMVKGTSDATTGGQVTKLQDFLRVQNMFLKSSTGYFDEDTVTAVAKWQKYIGFADELKTPGTVGPKTQEYMNNQCVVGTDTFPKDGKLFVTPNGTPTIHVPTGWKTTVLVDNKLSTSTISGAQTVVTFTDGNNPPYRGLTYMLYANGGSTGNDVGTAEVPIVTNILKEGMGPKKIISNKDVYEESLFIKEIVYEGVDDVTDSDSVIKTRIFSLPNYTYVLTGASSKKYTAYTDIHTWYSTVFGTLHVPSKYKTLTGGIPVNEYLAQQVTYMRSLPQGIAKEFYLSECPTVTEDLVYGDTDSVKKGQIKQLQRMLSDKYQITPGMITGTYDGMTLLAVIRFQREMGLEGSGGVGVKTRAMLDKCKIASL